MGVRYTDPHAIENPNITLQLALHIHSCTSIHSTNLRLWSTILHIYWKTSTYKWTHTVQTYVWESAVLSFALFSDSVQSLRCARLCDPVDYSMPGFPVHHQLPEPNQTHVHRVSDAIHPSHPLSSASPPAFSLSQYQGLFQWVSSSHQVAKVLEF